jgi:hypothetical protein
MSRPDEVSDRAESTSEAAPVPAASAESAPSSSPPEKGSASSSGSEPELPSEGGSASLPAKGDTEGDLDMTVAALTADELEPGQRRRLLGRLAVQLRARGLGDLFRPRAAARWMTDVVTDIAPHLPLRDLDTLRRHYDGLDGELLAERLVRNAARATASVGAAGGGFASIEWVVTPTLLSAPVLLTAETIAVVAIEMKLIGELHEVYRQPVRGGNGQRAVTLAQAWASQREVNPVMPGVGVSAILSTAARKELRDRLLRRFGRNLTTFGPFLTGAAVAGYLNRRATRYLGDQVRDSLRRRQRELGAHPLIED